MELENNEEGNGKGNKKRIAIIAVVVAALIAAGIAAFLLLSPHEPEASSIKDAATTTQEQLDEEAMRSRLWISVANTIYADSATDTCYATDKDGNKITVLDNREENTRDMFFNCSRLSVNCSSWDVSKVTNHSNFNTNAPGVILPLAWQTSSDEGDENSAIAPLCEEQGNGDALSVPSENDNNDADEAVSKTDGKASADSETEGSNTASATDEAGAKEEEASGDIVQEEPAAA